MSGWKKEAAQQSTEMTQQQFEYQKKLIDQREAERTAAMGQMNYLLNNQPNYQIPPQVQQYTNLMNTLGAQLYGLQDASGGAKSIDASQYASKTTQVDPWKSGAPAYNPIYPKGETPGGGGTNSNNDGSGPRQQGNPREGTHRDPLLPPPTTQGRKTGETGGPTNSRSPRIDQRGRG